MHKNTYIDIEFQIRSIIWIVKSNDWESLYEIIRMNSCNYGGVYFPIIQLKENNLLYETDINFIYAFDPDIIILPPNIEKSVLNIPSRSFGLIEWNDRNGILNKDLNGGSSSTNFRPFEAYDGKYEINTISTNNCDFRNESLLSFLYFGGVNAIEPMWHVMDDDVDFMTYGQETHLIEKMLRKDVNRKEAKSHLDNEKNIIPSPNRTKLNEIIDEKYLFPFGDFEAQLNLISDTHNTKKSFLQNTYIKSDYRWDQFEKIKKLPAVNIFISDQIDFDTALNIWNSKAIGINTFWFNKEVLFKNMEQFVKWVDSDYGGGFCSFTTNREAVILLSAKNENIRSQLKETIDNKREKDWPRIEIRDFELVDSSRPILKKQKTLCVKEHDSLTFFSDPQFINEISCCGTFTVRILDNRYKLPYGYNDYRSISEATYYCDGHLLPKIRIDINGYIVIQQNMSETIQINYPTDDDILDYCLLKNSLKKIYTTTGKYQNEILNIFGSIEEFSSIYYNPNNKNLFDTLVKITDDKKDKGWVVQNPTKMRLLNYDDFKDLVIRDSETEKDEFIKTLVQKEIIEYGLYLKCQYCDFSSFYYLNDINKYFSCNRCSKDNLILNKVELKYKLNPILQDGIGKNNIDVPLGAINFLRKKALFNFRWYRDLNISDGKNQRNIDLVCFIDGNLYLGEAKKNNKISSDQFDFYQRLSNLNIVSGLIFATKSATWNKGTQDKINSMNEKKNVIIINNDDLYK